MWDDNRMRWGMHQLFQLIPDAQGALHAESAYQLLIAVILSAQTTDAAVNKVTPALFAAYPTPAALAAATPTDIENYIHTIGLFHTKAKHIQETAHRLVTDFESTVPQTHQELESLPGVGRKTANVVLGDAFGVPSFAVDTHVTRISKRLPVVLAKASVTDIERRWTAALPKDEWVQGHHTLILFGRQYCMARRPRCAECPLAAYCATGQKNLERR
ncbi:MAG: endonuclease III [Schleiferilactobacillus perolens]|jgi:endonuclease-3|uniref:Endonuclease III n=1 Tax=Schleiferilactobacillus perolens DSM 12744 TaxID=1423792 RepID=A0A0R1N870_9LACO|nr:endonuclease III [Schleiferilactobacillus perolens]KRL14053.1 endonuclease III [Schleiferilactobacillus perolens DSM 12744]